MLYSMCHDKNDPVGSILKLADAGMISENPNDIIHIHKERMSAIYMEYLDLSSQQDIDLIINLGVAISCVTDPERKQFLRRIVLENSILLELLTEHTKIISGLKDANTKSVDVLNIVKILNQYLLLGSKSFLHDLIGIYVMDMLTVNKMCGNNLTHSTEISLILGICSNMNEHAKTEISEYLEFYKETGIKMELSGVEYSIDHLSRTIKTMAEVKQ